MSSTKTMRKAPYYPQVSLVETRTKLGAIETAPANLYEKPIFEKYLYKIDLLRFLEDKVGKKLLDLDRRKLYIVVSGTSSEEDYKLIMKNLYANYEEFRMYMDQKVIFGDKEEAPVRKIVKPLRDFLDSKREELLDYFESTSGKYLMQTNEYIYVAFRYNADLSKFGEAATRIGAQNA